MSKQQKAVAFAKELLADCHALRLQCAEQKKRADYLSAKLQHLRVLLQLEYERAERAEDDCEDLACLATQAVEKMLEGPTMTLEEVKEKYGI